MTAPKLLVFDSGLGGLTVYREVVGRAAGCALSSMSPTTRSFPTAAAARPALIDASLALMGELIATHPPDLVVIACNTASTLVLPQLRARFAVPFVGTVPAIKPACAASVSKRVSVLGTQATVAREYTRALIRDFANGTDVTLVGSARLAALAEAELRGERRRRMPPSRPRSRPASSTRRPAHRHGRARLHALSAAARRASPRLAPWPVPFIDPAPAIARRVLELMGGAGRPRGGHARRSIRFTCGRPPPPALAAALARFRAAAKRPAKV